MQRVMIKCQGADFYPVEKLISLQGNLKKLSAKSLAKLKKAIITHGFIAPIFIWKHAGKSYILDGNQRIRAILSLQEEGYEIPPLPVDFIQAESIKDAKIKLLHITSQYGEFDKAGLDEFILEGELDITELTTIRLTNTELQIAGLNDQPATAGDDDIPDETESITNPGDIWQLGEHKLICADSTDNRTFIRLLEGKETDLLLTDPPYNVDYTGKTKEALKIKNDKKRDADFCNFLVRAFANIYLHLKAGAAFYIFHSDSELYNFSAACRITGFGVRQCLIWNKNVFVMGRKDYQTKHEPCLYGWKEGGTHHWYGDRSQTTVIDFPRPAQSKEHPTMKPVDLLAYLMTNSTQENDIIFDPFAGSGSTLIAAEKLGRISFSVEIDPHYCDVAAGRYARWCEKNGRKVSLKLNGKRISPEAVNRKPDKQPTNRGSRENACGE